MSSAAKRGHACPDLAKATTLICPYAFFARQPESETISSELDVLSGPIERRNGYQHVS